MQTRAFTFPVGYQRLHRTAIINYQLNRWHSFGYLPLESLGEAAGRIRKLDDWKPEMVRQAEVAEASGRMMEAAFFYRSAEFFTLPSDPDKLALYDRFQDLFYRHVFDEGRGERKEIPYKSGALPTLRFSPISGSGETGILVVHGGFDSFMEEFYSLALWFSERGYQVILFEGPGQGAALRRHGLPLTLEWEKPAEAVLDHFVVDKVTWLGISLGGWLCFRAAAFEPRIARVIASSIFMVPAPLRWLVELFLRSPRLMDGSARLKARLSAQEHWGLHQMLHVFQASTPTEGVRRIMEFDLEHQHPERVTQDVLILTGEKDHFVPFGMQRKFHRQQMEALTAAHSVTGRIFTAAEQAQNHCQVGNFGLAMEEMAQWMEGHDALQRGNRAGRDT